ncbi:MAG: hypothetical protein PVI90_00425 [Desulfobacteraceae bacterium]|jgi:hypothetical protein
MKYISILVLCLFSSLAYATPAYDVVAKTGTDFVATGKLLPKELLKEYQKLIKALKEARKAERAAHKRLKDLLERAPEQDEALIAQFDNIVNNLKRIGREVDGLKGDNATLKEKIAELQTDLCLLRSQLGFLFDNVIRLWEALKKKSKGKDEGWAFGITTYGSADFATNKVDLMPIGGAALTAAWHKNKLTMGLMLGAGVSVLDGAALSWTFLPNLLFDVSKKLTLGPALIITQDLGNMEGADRMIYAGGCKVQTTLWGFNIWGVPTLGLHGERGYGVADPTYSFNVGVVVGVDWMFLK